MDLHRQVRAEGPVEQVDDATADAYFATLPLGSRPAAAASPQSQVVSSREELEERFRSLEQRYPDGNVPRPRGWGDSVSCRRCTSSGRVGPIGSTTGSAIGATEEHGSRSAWPHDREVGMRLTVLGSAGTYPVRGRPASGYLIEHEGTRVWCDAGPGTMTELPVAESDIDAVFVSHRHPDHRLDVIIASHVLAYGPRLASACRCTVRPAPSRPSSSSSTAAA